MLLNTILLIFCVLFYCTIAIKLFDFLQGENKYYENINMILAVGWFITIPVCIVITLYKYIRGIE